MFKVEGNKVISDGDFQAKKFYGDGSALTGVSGGAAWGSITGTLSDQTDLQTEIDTKADTCVVNTYTSSDTWTKPAGAKIVEVILISGGGGGGSGARSAAGTWRPGGAGGAGGAMSTKKFPASILGSTETVTIGAGGTGGAAISADNTNGNAGTAGGNTSFGAWVIATGGGSGGGGDIAQQFASNDTVSLGWNNSEPRTFGNGQGGSSPGEGVMTEAFAGGGGGGAARDDLNADYAATAGSAGSYMKDLIGYAGGTVSGGAGTGTTAGYPYGGGGGGGASVGATGGNGGIYGGGGGGGGYSTNGTASGAGGNGASGMAIVITYF